MEGKKNTDKWFPVVLLDDTDGKTPELTITYSDIVCDYCYEAAASISVYSVTSADWKESGIGLYWLNIGAGEFTNNGKYEVSVSAAVARTYRFWVEVVNKTSVEVSDDILDVSASVDNVQVTVNQISADTDDISELSTTLELAYVSAGIIDQGNEYWAASAASSASTTDISNGSITNIVNAILSATIDTKTYEEVMEILLAMASGKIVRTANRFQYMKQDGSTALFTLESSSSERTRL
ncbi:MAG: hypothetical protein PHF86_13135 [Candidatus Nanoarchaeia archaeon]|nr:hypothetical protein [Candidatus Nanoarchaeia archaeon]